MISVVDVSITACNPSAPLFPWRSFVNSPSSLRIRNVPKSIGKWRINNIYVTATYPDNSIKTAQCVLVGGVWVGTIAGSTTSGTSTNGYSVFASGTDENGNEVNNYCLGKGDIQILEADGTITPNQTTYYVHMLSAEPSQPKEGDLWQVSGNWFLYQDGTAYPIGDDSGLILQLSADLSAKQDKLTDPQLSAIDSVVDERATTIAFTDGTISSFNWQGEINYQTVADEGLFDTSILVFSWTKNPTSARIGTMVSSIGDHLFSGCTTLTSVSIPDSVVDIKTGSFVGCSRLSNFTLPNSLTSIGQAAFQSFATEYSNAAIDIPDSVKVIGNRAFISSGLTKITIGRGINSIGSDAFLLNDSLTNVTFIDRLLPMIQSSANYPWGITNTSIIKTWHDASQEWVQAQNYALLYPFVVGAIRPTGGRTMQLQPYKVTTFSINSAVASFKIVPQGTAGTTMRDYYLSLTLGAGVTQPMTWDATVDVFEGGSAEAVAPKAGKTNLYHIYEYISGHFAVSLLGSAYDALGDVETILNNL